MMEPSRKLLMSAGLHFNLVPTAEIPAIDFDAVFAELKASTCEIAYDQNDHNNRFSDIRCPSATRLKDSENKVSLHANRVILEGRSFIATQYPLPTQFSLFWKIAAPCSLIIDLSNEKDALFPYFPPHGAQAVFQTQAVSSLEVDTVKEYTAKICTYKVCNLESTDSPTICTRIHFEGWQDNDRVGEQELSFLLTEIEKRQNNPQIPTIIHCKAGVGRTGTLIVASALKKRIHEGKVTSEILLEEIKTLILEGRKQRGEDFVSSSAQLAALFTWGLREIERLAKR